MSNARAGYSRHSNVFGSQVNRLLMSTALVAALSVVPLAAFAQTWDGDTDDDFLEDTNWDGDVAPTATGAVVLDDGALPNQPTLGAGDSSTVDTVTVSDGTLTVDGNLSATSGVLVSGGLVQVGAAGSISGDAETQGTGQLTLDGSLTGNVTNGGTLTVNATGQVDGDVTTSGSGTLVLDGGDVTGSITLAGGILNATSNTTISPTELRTQIGTSGTVSADAGVTLTLNTESVVQDNTTTTFGSAVQTGTVVLNATGAATGSNANVTIAGGTLRLNSLVQVLSNSGGFLAGRLITVDSGATLDVNGITHRVSNLTGGGTVTSGAAGSATLRMESDVNSTFSGLIENGAATVQLLKQQGGTLTLSGANTYTGTTTVDGGILDVSGSIGSTSVIVNTSGSLQVAGASLLDTAVVTLNGAGNLTLTGSEVIGSLVSASGTSTVTLGANTLTTAANTAVTFAGAASGAGGLTKEGTGELTLTGANTYLGATTINGGTLNLSTGSVAGNVVVNSGTLSIGNSGAVGGTITTNGSVINYADTVNSGAAVVVNSNTTQLQVLVGSAEQSGAISELGGPRPIEKIGAGTLLLSGANSYTGVTTVTAGTLNVTGGSALSDVARVNLETAGTLGVLTDETVGSLAGTGALVLTGTLTAGGDNTNSTYAGVASGAGGLVKAGTGTLTMTGVNTYTGATDVTGGILAVTGTGSLASTDLETTAGGILRTDGNGLADTAIVTNAGTLSIQGDELIGAVNGAGAVAISAGQTLQLGTGVSLISGVVSGGSGGLTVQGTSNTTLSGTNTYGGTTTIAGGTLQLTGGNAIANGGVVTMSAGLLDVNTAETIGSLATTSGAVNLDATLTTGGNNGTTSVASVIGGTGGLTKAGSGVMTLTAANTYSGDTTVSGGTLALTGSGAVASAVVGIGAAGTLTSDGGAIADTAAVSNAGVLTITAAETIGSLSGAGATNLTGATLTTGDATSTVYSGVASGNGGLVKAGAGTFTLSGANTYSGTTTVDAGVLNVTGSVASAVITVNTGGSLQVDGASLANTAAVTLNGTGNLTLTGSEVIGSLASASATSTVTLGANTLTTGGANTSTTFAGVASGAGGLTKAGTGTFTLTGASTYSGLTSVSAGTLNIQNAAALGSAVGATTVSSGATLALQSGITIAENITLNGTGVGAGGALRNVSGTNQVNGTVTLASAARINSDAGQLGLTNVTGANVNLTIGGLGNTSVNNITTGTGSLTKDGAGIAAILGTGSFTGGTTINAGTLQVSGGSALADTSLVTIASGAILDVLNSETVGNLAGAGTAQVSGGQTLTAGAAANSTFSGVISEQGGPGSFTKQGTGTLTLSGANTYTGDTTVNAGILDITGSVASTVVTANAGGTVRVDGASLLDTAAVSLNGTGNLTLTGAETIGSLASASATSTVTLGANTLTTGDATDTTFAGVASGTGGLTKVGAGAFTLSGANTYTGTTTLSAGTLNLNGGAAIADTGAVIVDAGVLEINSTEVIGSLAGLGGTVDLNANGLTTGGNGTSTSYAGIIAGGAASNLTKAAAGTMTLTGASTYTGSTDVTGGTLAVTGAGTLASLDIETSGGATFSTDGAALLVGAVITNAGALNFTGAESIASVNGAGTVLLDGALTVLTLNSGVSAVSGVISATGALIVTGSSDTTLTAANTYTGDTDVAGTGQLSVTGTGTLASLDIETADTGMFDTDGGALLIGTAITNNSTNATALTLTGAESIASVTGPGTVFLNGAAAILTLNSGTSAISGVVSGSGGLTVTGTSTTTLSAANTYTGLTTVSGGTLNVTGSIAGASTVSSGILNVAGGTAGGLVTNSGGTVNLSAGGALTTGLTNSGGTFNVLVGNSGSAGTVTNNSGTTNVQSGATLAATTVSVNGGAFNLSSGAVTGGTFNNAAAGTLNVSGSSSIGNAFANAGAISLTGSSATTDILTLTSVSSGNLGTITANIDFNAGTSDQITSTGGGITAANVIYTTTGNGVTGPITVLTGLDAGATLSSNLAPGGSVVRVLTQNGNQGQVVSLVNPAISGIASAASVTQSLIASIVNRPTSPFVSGLAAEESCSSGGYARLTGGIATVTGTSTSNGQPVSNDLDARYYGLQGGYDFGCFDGRYFNGWDGAVGIMGGVNYGTTEQNVYENPLDTTSAVTGQSGSDFDQSYIGFYAAASRDKLSGDVQLRFDNTQFTLNDNTGIGFDGQEFKTTTSTIGARFNYRNTLNEEKGISLVPTIGFTYSHTSGDQVTFNGDGLGADETLVLDPFNSFVGFFGATIARTTVSPTGTAATTMFASGNYYNDFSDERTATFTDEFGGTNNITLDGIGGFAEASIGINYVKVLEGGPGGAKQLNANIRADARIGENVKDAYSLTAQVRLSF